MFDDYDEDSEFDEDIPKEGEVNIGAILGVIYFIIWYFILAKRFFLVSAPIIAAYFILEFMIDEVVIFITNYRLYHSIMFILITVIGHVIALLIKSTDVIIITNFTASLFLPGALYCL